ncbi:glutathione peroxidase [Enterococcus sp. JM9B]|uniref:glutathione peroxidase n=1 Tax=Enterococcus sp. JM9B TaxID=1857216 RepID=UPI0013751E93|nr:glutathione peroxidase [Enterococcus sp. JM9B]KAF1300520.1 glutathione peroxidase [Enterococcus sp. JM9B]
MTVYDYQATTEDGKKYSLDQYKGKVLVIVNTATKCGLAPQFEELEQLYKTYQEQGFVILGFPSNQFKQEVSSSKEAAESCRRTYGVTFPMHEIAEVNGENALPLFKYLEEQAPGTLGKALKWNFTKFLIDREGNVVQRFAPQTNPQKMTEEIEELLKK